MNTHALQLSTTIALHLVQLRLVLPLLLTDLHLLHDLFVFADYPLDADLGFLEVRHHLNDRCTGVGLARLIDPNVLKYVIVDNLDRLKSSAGQLRHVWEGRNRNGLSDYFVLSLDLDLKHDLK